MTYTEYKALFDAILDNPNPAPPYDSEAYLEYTKLNRSRIRRWDSQLVLSEKIVEQLQQLNEPRNWIIITEPWCGDAAHLVPFLVRMAEQSNYIRYDIQLRDSEPFLIDRYLTDGTKSIPKLIVRDDAGKDLFTWGPRPEGARQLMAEQKALQLDFESIKIALQKWYNDDKGESVCRELSALLG